MNSHYGDSPFGAGKAPRSQPDGIFIVRGAAKLRDGLTLHDKETLLKRPLNLDSWKTRDPSWNC